MQISTLPEMNTNVEPNLVIGSTVVKNVFTKSQGDIIEDQSDYCHYYSSPPDHFIKIKTHRNPYGPCRDISV